MLNILHKFVYWLQIYFPNGVLLLKKNNINIEKKKKKKRKYWSDLITLILQRETAQDKQTVINK